MAVSKSQKKKVAACETQLVKLAKKHGEGILVTAFNRRIIKKRKEKKLLKEIAEQEESLKELRGQL